MTDQEPTLDSTLSDAFDNMQSDSDDAVVNETPSTGRDERGRFVGSKQNQAVETQEYTEAVEQAPATEENTDHQGDTETVEAAPPIDAPASWSAEAKEIFGKLPPDAQKYITQRESEREAFLTQKSQEAATIKRQFEPLNSLIEPRRHIWAANGYSPDQAIGQVLSIAERASADPVGFIREFASDNGIDLKQLVGEAAQTPGQQPQASAAAPNLTPVINEINAIKQQLFAEKQAAINSQIEAFKSQPGHEHFDEVRLEMSALIREGHAKDMDEAYDMACWAKPSVRAKLMEAQRKEEDRKRIDAAKQAATKAIKSSGTQLSTKASLPSSNPVASSWEDSLSRAYDQMQGAA